MSGDVGEDVEEVRQGVDAIDSDEGRGRGNAVTFTDGAGAVKRAGIVPGVVRTVKEVLYYLVGGGNVKLINVVNLRPRDSGEGGGGDGSGGERRRCVTPLDCYLTDCRTVPAYDKIGTA